MWYECTSFGRTSGLCRLEGSDITGAGEQDVGLLEYIDFPTYLKSQTSLVTAMVLLLKTETLSKSFSKLDGSHLDTMTNFHSSLLATHLCSCACP